MGASGTVASEYAEFSLSSDDFSFPTDMSSFSGWFVGTDGTITVTSGDDVDALDGYVALELDTVQWEATNPGSGLFESGTATISTPSTVSVAITDDDAGGNTPPTADPGGPYSIDEGSLGSITLSALGSSDSDGSIVSYAWDLDNDGQYDDATGATATFWATDLDGPSSQTVGLQVTDNDDATDEQGVTISILNVAPTVTLSDPAIAYERDTFTCSGHFVDPLFGRHLDGNGELR